MKPSKPVRLYALYFSGILFILLYAHLNFPSLVQPIEQPVAGIDQSGAPARIFERAPVIPTAAAPAATSLPDTARQAEHLSPGGYKVNSKTFIAELPELESPDLKELIAEVRNGQANDVRGVYVSGVLALPVIQQPETDATFVSLDVDVITQFKSAARNGITGFLAHNFLSGQLFYKLKNGQSVAVIYGDGSIKRYLIEDIQRFQKLSPESMQSLYRDLSDDKILTTSQVFSRFYRGAQKAIFQTCLEKDGELSWGLIFIVAEPLGE